MSNNIIYNNMSKSFPNGVNVEQLVGTINAIKYNPSIADIKSKTDLSYNLGEKVFEIPIFQLNIKKLYKPTYIIEIIH